MEITFKFSHLDTGEKNMQSAPQYVQCFYLENADTFVKAYTFEVGDDCIFMAKKKHVMTYMGETLFI